MKGYYTSVLIYTSLFVLLCCGESNRNSPPSAGSKQDETAAIEEPIFVDTDAGKTWHIFGIEIVGKIMSHQTNGEYSVVVSTTPPDGGPPLHVHENEDELFYVLEGEYEFRCGEKKIRVSKGALVHLPRKLPHGFRNVGKEPGMLMNTIMPGGFEHFFEEVDQLPKDMPLERKKVQSIASKYGLKFLPDTNC